MFAKICITALSIAAAVAEPPVNHGYLPPVTGKPGYNYPTPNQPLNPPSQPPYQPPPPPPQRPTYGPPLTNRPPPPPPPPSYGPPVTNRPPPPRPPPYTPGPTYGPPAPPPPPRPSYGPPTGGSDYKPNQIPGGRPIIPGGNIQNDIPTGPSGGGDHDHHDHHHHEPGMPFDFNYAVKDDYYGTDYSHNAVSDGDVVRGEYKVLLPDGRLQIVTYTADWKNGFNADIKYQGEPTYPAPGQSGQNRPGTGPSGNYQSPGSGPY